MHKNIRGTMINLNYPITGGQYKISQPFGTNPDGYPDFYQQFGFKGHNGIDFYGNKNEYIFATIGGRVIKAHFDSTGYGNLVVIKDESGGQHYYAHLNSIAVSVGKTIETGNLIGYMGNTGNIIGNAYSDGTHLHYGYRPVNYDRNNGYGGFVDPMPYFENQDISVQEAVATEPGWSEVVCEDGANVRESAGGTWKTWFPKGVRVYRTGYSKVTNGLPWEEIIGGLYVARHDSIGTVILEDVKNE